MNEKEKPQEPLTEERKTEKEWLRVFTRKNDLTFIKWPILMIVAACYLVAWFGFMELGDVRFTGYLFSFPITLGALLYYVTVRFRYRIVPLEVRNIKGLEWKQMRKKQQFPLSKGVHIFFIGLGVLYLLALILFAQLAYRSKHPLPVETEPSTSQSSTVPSVPLDTKKLQKSIDQFRETTDNFKIDVPQSETPASSAE